MTDEITFDEHYRVVFDRDEVAFWAAVGGKRIPCTITKEALSRHFGEPTDEERFSANRTRIEGVARRLIREGHYAGDEIHIYARDLD